LKNSLFFKVFISIIITSSIVLGISFYFLKAYQERNLFKNLETYTYQLSNTIKGSLYHAMLTEHRDEIQNIITTVSRQEGIDQVFVLDRKGKIVFSPFQEEIGKTLDKNDATCIICHKGSPKAEVETIVYKNPEGKNVFRNVNPIYSAPACHRCHDANEKIRGILITDIPVTYIEEQIASNSRKMLVSALIVFIALGFILFVSLSKLILIPLKTLVSGTKEISSGNLAYQIPLKTNDEMGALVSSFNSMAASLKGSRDELLKTIEDVRELNEELTTLYRLIQEITSTIELDKLKKIVLNIINEALLTEECYLVTFNYKTNTGILSLKDKSFGEIKTSRIELPFTFDENLDQEAFLTSKELKEKLPFYERITSLSYERELEIISLPLQARNTFIGIVSARKGNNQKFSKTEVRIFDSLSKSLAISIQNSLLYEMAITDGLTGFFSKSYFERMLEVEVKRAKRFNTHLSLIILDIDGFKSINDKYGHQVGDMVLRKLSSNIKSSIRSIDIPCRFGGDEFTILLPDTNSSGSLEAAERIVTNLKELQVVYGKEDEKLYPTISLGCATYPEDANTGEELFQKADKALYKAKNLGRNKVVVYSKIEQ